jgi:hypothetical protein
MDRITSGTGAQPSYGPALIAGRSAQAESVTTGGGEEFVKTGRDEFTEQMMALRDKAQLAPSKQGKLSVGNEMLLAMEEQITTHGIHGSKWTEQAEKLYLANGERLSY